MEKVKRLYKSEESKVFTGVIGGLGEYLDIDPVVLRLVWAGIVVSTALFPGLLVYVAASIIIPALPSEK